MKGRRPRASRLACLLLLAAAMSSSLPTRAAASSRLLLAASPAPEPTPAPGGSGGRLAANPSTTNPNNNYPMRPSWTCRCGRSSRDVPVCGSNGRSYINECMAICDRAGPYRAGPCAESGSRPVAAEPTTPTTTLPTPPPTRSFDGQAPVTCRCTKIYLPQCGKDGVTYANPCLRECDKVELASEGPCADEEGAVASGAGTKAPAAAAPPPAGLVRAGCERTDRICPANYAPICGTDGKTYANDCLFECRPVDVEKRAVGECEAAAAPAPPSPPPAAPTPVGGVRPGCEAARACTLEYNPICGTDGKTYGNPCAFECRPVGVEKRAAGACEPEETALPATPPSTPPPPVTGAAGPSSPPRPSCVCPLIYAPVCSKSGKTFGNSCGARCAGEEVARQGRCEGGEGGGGGGTVAPTPTPTTPKPPPSCVCDRSFRQVCGRDGKTYNNICLMQCASVEFKSAGPCPAAAAKAPAVPAAPAAPAQKAAATPAPAAAPAPERLPASCGCTGPLRGLCAAFRRAFDPARCGGNE